MGRSGEGCSNGIGRRRRAGCSEGRVIVVVVVVEVRAASRARVGVGGCAAGKGRGQRRREAGTSEQWMALAIEAGQTTGGAGGKPRPITPAGGRSAEATHGAGAGRQASQAASLLRA